MEDPKLPAPTPGRPLLGLTVLVVEDSRFACEAMRLLCLRSGARIRRADCIRSARRHLQVYRPSVALVDLGLPDGSGLELISDLAQGVPRIGVIIGISGDDAGAEAAIAAGADGFLAKPVDRLGAFQSAISRHLPPERRVRGPHPVSGEVVHPDRLAFREDMAHLDAVMRGPAEGRDLDYVAQFLRGIARSAGDRPLEEAAHALARSRREGRTTRSDEARIAGLVRERLAETEVI